MFRVGGAGPAVKAHKYCLDNLGPNDRFGLINFTTTINRYQERLREASR